MNLIVEIKYFLLKRPYANLLSHLVAVRGGGERQNLWNFKLKHRCTPMNCIDICVCACEWNETF